MNTDPNESNKRPNEGSEQENESTEGSAPLKKIRGIGPNEHAKPKRRGRRGKKRKQRKSSGGGAPCGGGSDHHEDCGADHHHPTADCEKHCMSWDSDEEDIEVEDFNLYSDVMIRPTDVPKAPENSTQFIIDDHDECRLYKSFETPNPYLPDFLRPENDNSEIIEPEGEDAAYVDINYEYESPHDFDNSAYYDREFELSYKNNRYDELLRLSREELITGLRNLQDHIQELNQELVKEDPDPILERLQTELLEQQEKHSLLVEANSRLQNRLEEAGIDYQSLEEQSSQMADTSDEHVELENPGHFADTSEQHLEDIGADCGEERSFMDAREEFLAGDDHDEDVENQCIDTENVLIEQPENIDSERLYDYSDSMNEPSFQCPDESQGKPNSQSPLSEYNQKSSESPCHIPCMGTSPVWNKENACYDEVSFEERLQSAKCTPRHMSCSDSCIEHIRVKEKSVLQDSEFSETQRCEEMQVGSTVSPEHELVTV